MTPISPPSGIEQARVIASPLAEEAFRDAEVRHAKGVPFEAAKLAALEERVPAILAEHGETVADLVVQMVMQVPEGGVHPAARRRFRDKRWAALVAPLREAGAPEPAGWERKLYEWVGRMPSGLRRLKAGHPPS